MNVSVTFASDEVFVLNLLMSREKRLQCDQLDYRTPYAGAVMFYGIFFKETVALDVLKVNSTEKLTRIVAAGSHVVFAGLSVMFKLMDKFPA